MVEIVAYQHQWPEEFRTIAEDLRRGLGAAALRIDHIGSTAVPGLAAKNVVDIQVTVAALDDRLLERFTALGYRHSAAITSDHRPPDDAGSDSNWQKWFFKPPPDQRPTNTHVRLAGRPNQRYALLFRDYLRAHPASAAAYAELKRRLARELRDVRTYPDVKDPAVDLIYLAAQEWAQTSGWQPERTDA
jgi:GrpB-like predicted nucleotidyltransferase (UPF0157 family)